MKDVIALRVLHIIPSLAMGGAERLTLDICSELANRDNVSVCLVLLHEHQLFVLPTNFVTYHTEAKVKLSILRKNKKEIAHFQQIVTEFKPNVIHSHLFEAEILSRAKLFDSILYVTHVHDNMQQLKRLNVGLIPSKVELTNYYERAWILKKYKKIDNHFITISNDTDRYIQKNVPSSIARNRTKLLNAINFQKFNKHRKYNKDIERIRLICIGSFVLKKNQLFLLDVILILVNKGLDVHLTLVGDGPLRSELEDKIEALSLNSYVTLVGNTEQVEFYLSKSTVYVHAAIYEPFGLVLLEAMASGLPVVCVDGKGNRDLVKEGSNGFMLKHIDPSEMAAKIIELSSDIMMYESISDNAVAFASQFDLVNYTDRLVNLYTTNLLKI
jgi:glycosyltransferase involved in cell wall biosynthesis